MTSPLIRPVRPSDIPAIAAIYADEVLHGTATFELDPPGEAEMERRRAALVEGGFPYIVAEVDGRVLGYAYAGAYRPRPAYRFTLEDSIYLDRAARGQGIGTKLLDALVEESTRLGFRQMIGVIGDSANAGSRKLHARCGFTYVGTLADSGWKFGRWLDTVLMQRALGPGATVPAP